jgi:hypothetical protein
MKKIITIMLLVVLSGSSAKLPRTGIDEILYPAFFTVLPHPPGRSRRREHREHAET